MSSTRSVGGYKHGRVPRAVRDQQLLDLAEPLFIEHGYAGFSIEDLCRAAGVSRPIVYERFGSKDGIYLAVLRRVRGEFEEALAEASRGPDLQSALQQGANAFFSVLERDPQRWSLVYGGTTALVGPLADQLADLRAATVEVIRAALAPFLPGVDDEQLTAAAYAISGAGEQLGRWWLRRPELPRERMVAYFLDFCAPAIRQLAAGIH
jgi:AcrR family transcriptional regulator